MLSTPDPKHSETPVQQNSPEDHQKPPPLPRPTGCRDCRSLWLPSSPQHRSPLLATFSVTPLGLERRPRGSPPPGDPDTAGSLEEEAGEEEEEEKEEEEEEDED